MHGSKHAAQAPCASRCAMPAASPSPRQARLISSTCKLYMCKQTILKPELTCKLHEQDPSNLQPSRATAPAAALPACRRRRGTGHTALVCASVSLAVASAGRGSATPVFMSLQAKAWAESRQLAARTRFAAALSCCCCGEGHLHAGYVPASCCLRMCARSTRSASPAIRPCTLRSPPALLLLCPCCAAAAAAAAAGGAAPSALGGEQAQPRQAAACALHQR